jgi:DNA-binding GntR family transcriptional regulator
VATELRSLRRQNLREEALAALRAAVLTGELEPDSIHSTTALAERLGVSPTPVREAMLELARQGLVEPLPNRGFRIVAAKEKDLDEIRDLRLMLEVPALAMVIERAEEAGLLALRPHVEDIGRAAERGDLQEFLTADRAFHLGLLELGRNERLVRIVGELRDQTRIMGLGPLAETGALKYAAAEHAAILDAVIARDVTAAQRGMFEHLHHTRGIWAGQTEPDSWEEILAQYPWARGPVSG